MSCWGWVIFGVGNGLKTSMRVSLLLLGSVSLFGEYLSLISKWKVVWLALKLCTPKNNKWKFDEIFVDCTSYGWLWKWTSKDLLFFFKCFRMRRNIISVGNLIIVSHPFRKKIIICFRNPTIWDFITIFKTWFLIQRYQFIKSKGMTRTY